MSFPCNTLAAALSERREGELSSEDSATLEAHLGQCERCRERAKVTEALLARLEPAPVTAEELRALEARRIAAPPRRAGPSGWRVPAALAAAAAAALTLWTSPAHRRHVAIPAPASLTSTAASEDSGSLFSEGLFSTLAEADDDTAGGSAELDALEGPGLFGNL
jgi:hypothetical protein